MRRPRISLSTTSIVVIAVTAVSLNAAIAITGISAATITSILEKRRN